MSVTVENVAVALGRATPADGSTMAKQWQMWIEDAQMLIGDRVEALGVEMPPEAKIDYVIRTAVVAHIRRPDDATQVTISVDDSSSQRTYQSGKGRVAITDEMWMFLGLVPTNGAFSIDTAPGPRVLHSLTCSTALGAGYCDCGADIAGEPIYGDQNDW